ncbi:pyridoxal phosphate-dependent aminotransferase [Dactylosporangium sp. NPDC051484]|uniref:pyridoxal phosphate-dependent aminotransferase n=1 Tax=Dactylosporangium sp. NPDC051484 TaxID=3154942 RepID=UPI0034510A68
MTATSISWTGPGGAGPAMYPMRRWVFEDSLGRYDIDLGDSHVKCGTLDQLTSVGALELNYGVDRGSAPLAELIAARYGGSAEHVLVTHGSQEALYLLYATLLRPGDRVIAFRPGWQQAWDVPERLGGQVELLDLTEDFDLDLDRLAAAGGDDLRLITVNTPSNPTGRRLRPHEFDALLALAERSGAYLVLDEEYVLDLSESRALGADRVISVSSVSKVYGFPGLRVGWMYGPLDVIRECIEYKHFTSISNSVLCEALAADVLARQERWAREYHRLVGGGLSILTGWAASHAEQVRLVPPEGTPFAWLHLRTAESSLSFVRRVLGHGVLVMPAETFGTVRGLRISFAREPEQLLDGLRRVSQSFAESEDRAT